MYRFLWFDNFDAIVFQSSLHIPSFNCLYSTNAIISWCKFKISIKSRLNIGRVSLVWSNQPEFSNHILILWHLNCDPARFPFVVILILYLDYIYRLSTSTISWSWTVPFWNFSLLLINFSSDLMPTRQLVDCLDFFVNES